MSLAKVELNDIGTLANPASARQALNDNFKKIEDEFEKVLHRDGSVPNSMEADLDMDSHRILNVADAVHDKDAVNKGQVVEIVHEAIEEDWQPRLDDLLDRVENTVDDLVDEATDGLRDEIKDGLKDEVKDEVKEELKDEVADEVEDRLIDELVAIQEAIDQEIADRIAGDLASANALAAEVLARVNAIAEEANARADADAQLAADILAEAAARGTAITNVTNLLESATESLAQQIAQVSAGTGEQFDPYIIWHFNSDNEGWGGPTEDGWLLPSGTTTANYTSPDFLDLDSTAYRYVKLRIKRVGSPGAWRGWLRWITPTDTTWDAVKEVRIPEPVFDADGIATIDFRDIGWTAEPVRRIRLYLADNPAFWPDTYLIDWVAIGRPSPGASTAALQEERMARISGDAAEAAAREVLATQLRGSYTGNDLSELTSGLLYSERVARSTGDAALASSLASEVTARETLQAQVNDPVTGLAATRARLITEESVRASADSALSGRLDVVEARMPAGSGELATAAALNALDGRVTSAEGQISSQASAITAVQAEIASKASSAAVTALDARVTSAEGMLSSQASAITSINATLNDQTASVTQLMEVTGAARLVDVRNPSFETNDGWAANTNGTGGLPSGVTYETATAHSGSRVLRFSGVSTVVHNTGRTPVRPGERLRVGGWLRQIGTAPNSGARLRIGVRGYDASGAYISGSALVPVDVVMSGRGFTFPAVPDTGIYTVPEGVVSVGLFVQTTNLTSGAIAVDDVFIERISETENRLMARHTLALDVNGNISGMVNENDGETSSFSILASIFRVISGPTAGIEWQNGYLRAYALGAQIVLGSNFGSGNDLMLWCGPNIGANNCSKANGTFWVDNTGDGYFAGRVLQGVLRWFNSTTSTASNASVTTGSNPRLGKNVALAARYQYSENWTYLGGTVSPGAGNTAATIVIERRYGSGSWTTLMTRTIPGHAEAYNNPGSGDPSSWNVTISGEVFATDTASTSDSEYRARITSRSVQSHNPGTDGQPVVINQYLSIEAME